jgi:hypothetical protein
MREMDEEHDADIANLACSRDGELFTAPLVFSPAPLHESKERPSAEASSIPLYFGSLLGRDKNRA